MTEIFVASVLVMLVMIAFMTLVVISLSQKLGKKIRDNVIRDLSSYDLLIKNKTAVIEQLNRELLDKKEELRGAKAVSFKDSKKASSINATALSGNEHGFIHRSFVDDYRTIRASFDFDKQRILTDISQIKVNSSAKELQDVLKKILEKLTFESVYKMSSLSQESQLEILKECFDEKEKHIINQFLQENNSFDIIEFYSWLKNIYMSVDDTIYVKSFEDANYSVPEKNVSVEVADDICDGMQVVYQNRLFDYSLQKWR